MRIKPDFSLAALTAIGATGLGISFHLGYAIIVGKQYLSYVSVADWVFVGASLYVSAVMLFAFVSVASPALFSHAFEEGRSFNRLLFAVFLLVIGNGVLPFIFVPKMPLVGAYVGAAFNVIVVVLLISWAAPIAFRLVVTLNVRGDLSLKEVGSFFLYCNLIAAATGLALARGSLTPCLITYVDGKSEVADYLRLVGDAHLIRKDGRIKFVSKSRVSEITCGTLLKPLDEPL